MINYNPHLDHLSLGNNTQVDGPPVAVLYHEMAHNYDSACCCDGCSAHRHPATRAEQLDGEGSTEMTTMPIRISGRAW